MKTVSHTLFFPLFGRASAARRWPELFSDPWAEQAVTIAETEGTPAQELGAFPTTVYGLRHLITVVEATRYLKTHPGAAVVNIGCGLDSLAQDLQGFDCTIYNLDFPDVIEMRGRWVPHHSNEVDLPYSVTDHEWMDQVDAENGMIALAPGVMYYIEISDARELIDAMAKKFPGGRFTYDAESAKITRFSEKQIAKKGTPVAMPSNWTMPRNPENGAIRSLIFGWNTIFRIIWSRTCASTCRYLRG